MILLGKPQLNDKDSKRFFESFSMTPSAPLSKPYISFRDTTMAFSSQLPHDPVINQRLDAPVEEDNYTGNGHRFQFRQYVCGNHKKYTGRQIYS